ncbi:MAG: hypothetical protein KAX38_09660, partial [Candidatus Krumholzibacteria bacterium]|nr:hypothetical protein [Candidatus Krumholzibacteria bacterium]
MENIRKLIPEDDDQKIDLYMYWRIFWRKKFYLLVPIILSLAISFFGVKHLTPLYKSSALLTVEDQNILSRMIGRYITPVEERGRIRDQQFLAMIDTRINSRVFLELIVDDLGLHLSNSARRALMSNKKADLDISADELAMRYMISILRRKIVVQNPAPGFFSINVYDIDPTTAYKLSSKISEKYIEVKRQVQLKGLRQAGEFSDEQ